MECLDPAGSLQITGDARWDLARLACAGRRGRGGWESQSAEFGLQTAVTGDG